MKTSHSLLPNPRHRATIMPAGMRANGNFSDSGLERLHVAANPVRALIFSWRGATAFLHHCFIS